MRRLSFTREQKIRRSLAPGVVNIGFPDEYARQLLAALDESRQNADLMARSLTLACREVAGHRQPDTVLAADVNYIVGEFVAKAMRPASPDEGETR